MAGDAPPSSDLQISWASEYIDSSYNAPGVQSPVVDKLIAQIIAAQGDKAKLVPLGRALDRVLTELLHAADVVYGARQARPWDKFSHPAIRPVYTIGLDTGMMSTKPPNYRQPR